MRTQRRVGAGLHEGASSKPASALISERAAMMYCAATRPNQNGHLIRLDESDLPCQRRGMPISCEHSVDVPVTPERAFALIDDLAQTPKWLGPCRSLDKVTPGPNAIGDKLRYAYSQGGRSGTMDGEILERKANERLVCRYRDTQMDVLVDLRVSPIAGGARLTHAITITPQTMMGKMMTPIIQMALPKQTKEAMENLKRILTT